MIIVTGGTGLLGSHLLFHIAQNDEVAFIRASYRSEHKIILVKKVNLAVSHRMQVKVWVKSEIGTDIQKIITLKCILKNYTEFFSPTN